MRDFRDTFKELTDATAPDEALGAVYTSGTTGDPSGVVLSHRNLLHQAVMQDLLVPTPEHPRSVPYLPMTHVAERMLSIYVPIWTAGHITTCPGPAVLQPGRAAPAGAGRGVIVVRWIPFERFPGRVQHSIIGAFRQRALQGAFQRTGCHVATGQVCFARRLTW